MAFTPIKLVEDYTVNYARDAVRTSLARFGEEAILLQLFHPGVDDDADRCPVCFDDVYPSAGFLDLGGRVCTQCYGTTFNGGVKAAQRVWAVFSDSTNQESIGKHGTWVKDAREIQCEPFPALIEHDVVVRVQQWSPDHRPLVVGGYYALQEVTRDSIRTGNRFGQSTWDVVGQRAQLLKLQAKVPILGYPVLGVQFAEPSTPPQQYSAPVTQPDVKVLFYPLLNTPPAEPTPAPVTGAATYEPVFTHVQATPAATWVISHPYPYNPNVNLVINGEECDTDVDYSTPPGTVTLVFPTPQVGTAELW